MRPLLLLSMTAAMGFGQMPPSDLDRVRVGEKAPDFTLESGDGRQVKLSEFSGKKVVLVFYRGYW